MSLTTDFPFRRVYFSPGVLRKISLPAGVRSSLDRLLSPASKGNPEASRSLAVLTAAEVIRDGAAPLPDWISIETSYLVLADVPEPALFRLPTILKIHKPDQRIHITRDPDSIKRQAIALFRDQVFEGIIDAYLLENELCVVLGDMSIRSYPLERLKFLSKIPEESLIDFEIHSSGSYLIWPVSDLRVGASQLIQAVDPMYLADIVIQRYAVEPLSSALRYLRESRGLLQTDIAGLSARHVRRLEREEARLTSDTAVRYAQVFGMSLTDFLEELASLIARATSATEGTAKDATDQLHHVS